jgi:hypothetical protein
MFIYPLIRNKPITITIPTNPSRIVVTDGFHITQPVSVGFSQAHTQYYKVACAIEDDQLLVGLIIMVLLYAMGATSGIIFLQVLSLAPIFYFLFLYYINRKQFIRILPV